MACSTCLSAESKSIVEQKPFLTLECKYQNDTITYADIAKIVGKFEPNHAKIQLIVARELGVLKDITKKMIEYVKGCTYVAYAERSDEKVDISYFVANC